MNPPETHLHHPQKPIDPWLLAWKQTKKFFIVIIGFTLVGIGAALVVLPGPGFLTIIVGLVLLGTEFAWARHWLHKIKAQMPEALRAELEQKRWKRFFH